MILKNFVYIVLFVALSLLFSSIYAFLLLRVLKGTVLERKNYRNELVASSSGLILGGFFITYLSLSLVLFETSFLGNWTTALVFLGIGTLFFGFLDDIYGDQTRGFRGHFKQLIGGKVTTGLIKAVGGFILSVVASYFVSRGTLDLVVNALMIALFINFFNLLDLRPARTLKVSFLLFVLAFTFSSNHKLLWVWLTPFVGPLLVLFYLDLTETAMLGDTGSNFIGALIGLIYAYQYNWKVNLPILIGLLLLQIYAERYSFGDFIRGKPLLRWLDNLGLGR